MDKIRYAKRQLARIPVMYEQLMRLHPDGMPSLGMVARFDRVGGAGGGFSSITESVAMKNLSITDVQREMLGWMDAACEVFARLNGRGKNPIKAQHDRKLALVLKGRVIDGLNFETIRDMHFREQISVQYVQKLYDDVVKLVADEAEKRGLYNGVEE